MANKELKSMDIYLMGGGSLNINDTEENPTIVDDTMKQFLNSDQIHVPANDGNPEYYIPFHAIDSVDVYLPGNTIPVPVRPNPYGCEAPGVYEPWAKSVLIEGSATLAFTINESGEVQGYGITTKSFSDWQDLYDNHNAYSVRCKATSASGTVQFDVPWDANEGWYIEYQIDANTEVEVNIFVANAGGYMQAEVDCETTDEITDVVIEVARK